MICDSSCPWAPESRSISHALPRAREIVRCDMHILSFKHVTLGCTTPDVSGGTMANLGMIFQLRNAGAVRTVNELAEV